MALNAYVKTPWLDKIVDETTGETIQDGTPITAARLGNLENGVSAVTGEVIAQTTQLTTTNTGNVYKVTVDPAPASYTDGMLLRVKINAGSTGAASFQINNLAAKPVYDSLGNAISNLKANTPYQLCYESTADRFIVLGKGGGGSAQPADVAAGKTFCNDSGQQVGTSTKEYGIGDTITDDNVVITQRAGSLAWSTAVLSSYTYACCCDNDYVYTGGPNSNYLTAWHVADGTKAWQNTSIIPMIQAGVDSSYLYVSDSSYLYKLNRLTGAQVWKVSVNGPSELCIDSSCIYLAVPNNSAITALNISDGSTKWTATGLNVPKHLCVFGSYVYTASNGGSTNTSSVVYRLSTATGAQDKASNGDNQVYYSTTMCCDGTYVYLFTTSGWSTVYRYSLDLSAYSKITIYYNGGTCFVDSSGKVYVNQMFGTSPSSAWIGKFDASDLSDAIWESCIGASSSPISANSKYAFGVQCSNSNLLKCFNNKATYKIAA